ncbi:DNA topoisomerase III [Billgrantia antri]|uniref:DNA topoisomerase n=1 Tax=Halomonas sulfidivorans TaxID=2733488 RepID=A0ABX7WF56_9GAMM|nr:DNA topoisomerase III [Halomonas sulfidivorans]QTP58152.1 DNA topoisomerase III [Halomonas sulfidivorans]
MRVFLCEKPSQARDIARVIGAGQRSEGFLKGEGCVVTWGFGHLLEQAPPEQYDPALKRWSMEALPILPSTWKMEIKKSGRKQFGVVKKLLGQATEVVVATDADREGETIARELLDYCGYRGRVTRLWLSALDDASIRKALAGIRPGEATYPLYLAGLGRSRADWLVGMNLTRAYTVLAQRQGHQGVLSVGRVQTPALRLVVDRDREIANFVPQPFWEVVAQLQAAGGTFQAKWQPRDASIQDAAGRCISEEAARSLAQRVTGQQGRVGHLETSRKKEAAPLVMDLSSLQQEASRRFGYGAQQVLDIAQALYEAHKATSYPRTDCRYLPESQLEEAERIVTMLLHSDEALSPLRQRLDTTRKSRVWNDSKITAHHGIIPTAAFDLAKLSDAERNVYDLIRRHYLAQFLPAHEYDRTELRVDLEGEAFVASGRQVRVEGWRMLFPRAAAGEGDEEEREASPLPALSEGESCQARQLEVLAKQTTPPKAFTEGTLIAAMKHAARFVTDERLKARLKETAGIGTEATRAGIIETLLKRGFIKRQKRALVSTPTGQQLIDALPTVITNPGMTALWEQALDDVAAGRLSLQEFMGRQAGMVEKLVQHARESTVTMPQPKSKTCPECQAPMRKRQGQYGAFWGCSRYPECRGMLRDKAPGKGAGSRRKAASP